VKVAQRLSQVSKAPVFGLLQAALGHGIAGGSLIDFEHIGNRAGQLALDILRGTHGPEKIPAFLDVPAVPMFDWRSLSHWKLDMDALPKGAIVVNRQFTLWDWRYYLIGILVFCLAESALIVMLIAQIRRKRIIEHGLRLKTEELDQFFNVTPDLFCIANGN